MRKRWRPVWAAAVGFGLAFLVGAVGLPGLTETAADTPPPPARIGSMAQDPSGESPDRSSEGLGVSGAGPRADGDRSNVLAIHDVSSPVYNGDCISCHGSVLTKPSQDPRILTFHQAMTPFMPGYNPAHGPDNDVCVQCHRLVELRMDSGGALRVQVKPELCALCHGPSGPGPVYYRQ